MRAPHPMARKAAAGIAVAALAGLACRRSAEPPPRLEPAAMRATLIACDGDVRVKRADANDYLPAARGAALAIADRIATGPGGHATLLFDDGTTAVVTPRSLVSIEPAVAAGGGGALQVERGRVDLDIAARGDAQFRVHTPEAQAAAPAREIMVVGGAGVRAGGEPETGAAPKTGATR